MVHAPKRIGVALAGVAGDREVPERIRLRVALDVLVQLAEDTVQPIATRSAGSKLRFANVQLSADAPATVVGQGDTSGAAILLWEILSGREAPAGTLPRVHDVVDEIHPDIDDVVAHAVLERRFGTVEELVEALQTAAEDRIATAEELADWLADPTGAAAAKPAQEAAKTAAPEPKPEAPKPEAPKPASATPDAPKPEAPKATPPVVRAPNEPSPSSKRRHVVLVITPITDADALAGAIEERGHIVYRVDASAMFDAALANVPNCIVFDLDQSGEAGYALVQRMRFEGSAVSAIPLLLLTHADDKPHLSGFLAGGDVCVRKPFRVDDVVAQVVALVRMSTRIRATHEWLTSRPVAKVFEGSLEHISIPTLLSILEMERRTGSFEVKARGGRRASLHFVAGVATNGFTQGLAVPPLSALQTMLSYERGRFSFTPMADRDPPPGAIGIGMLLLEALKEQDELTRRESEAEQSSAR